MCASECHARDEMQVATALTAADTNASRCIASGVSKNFIGSFVNESGSRRSAETTILFFPSHHLDNPGRDHASQRAISPKKWWLYSDVVMSPTPLHSFDTRNRTSTLEW